MLFIVNKTSAEIFLRNNDFDERIRKFKETNNFLRISTSFTSRVPSRRERDENVQHYGAGGKHAKRNTGKSKRNNKPPNDNPAKAQRGRMPLYAGYIDFKTDKVVGRSRSCLQDTIANIGLLFGHDLKDTIDKQIPPDTYNETCWFDVVKNKKIIEFLRFEKSRLRDEKVDLLYTCLKSVTRKVFISSLQKSLQIIQNIKIGTRFSTIEIS